jgi:hypothetical protein
MQERSGREPRIQLRAGDDGAVAGKVHLLVAGRDLPVEQDGIRLSVAVPSVRDHEVVAIDL